jgi:hypothetical protein
VCAKCNGRSSDPALPNPEVHNSLTDYTQKHEYFEKAVRIQTTIQTFIAAISTAKNSVPGENCYYGIQGC